MASTTSQIKAGLNEIATRIAQERSRLAQAKNSITAAEVALSGMPAQYGTLIADIDALTGTAPFVLLSKDEKAKLVAEFQALKSQATAAKNAVAEIL
jgi:predicted transcriptional regulator